MRDKILQTLRDAGHGLTPNKLMDALGCICRPEFDEYCDICTMPIQVWESLENDKLVFLHRADGSANTVKGEIVLITLRNNS